MTIDFSRASPRMTAEEVGDWHIGFYLDFGLNLGCDEFGDYPQGTIDHGGVTYVVDRISPTRLKVLGTYSDRDRIQREIDEALLSDDGQGVFGWASAEFAPY